MAHVRAGQLKNNRIKPKKWQLKDFDIGSCLGSGGFADVYLVKEKETNLLFALKVLNIERLVRGRQMQALGRELHIQEAIRHPNIVRLYTYFTEQAGPSNKPKYVCMLMEYVRGGELFQKLEYEGRFGEPQAARYIFQIAKAIQYLHNKKIIHRDLKLENIILEDDGHTIKLTDFGWAILLHNSKEPKQLSGTMDYVSPEMENGENYSYPHDIWQIGCLLYEFLYGKSPFAAESDADIRLRIRQIDLKFPTDAQNPVSHFAKDLIKKILVRKPQERLSLSQILNHPFITRHCNKVRE